MNHTLHKLILDSLNEKYPELQAKAELGYWWPDKAGTNSAPIIGVVTTARSVIHPTYRIIGQLCCSVYSGDLEFKVPIAAPDLIDRIAKHTKLVDTTARQGYGHQSLEEILSGK